MLIRKARASTRNKRHVLRFGRRGGRDFDCIGRFVEGQSAESYIAHPAYLIGKWVPRPDCLVTHTSCGISTSRWCIKERRKPIHARFPARPINREDCFRFVVDRASATHP